ncbi:MAG: NAD-dependent DNA ligase LigA [Candidatus Thermoplasmatota archaeon]
MAEDINKEEAKKEIEKLREKIRHHDYQYYVLNEPKVSDAEYDKLKKRLQKLENQFPDLVTPDSPTQRVGAPPADEFETVEHVAPMLSLDTADREEVKNFDDRMKRELDVDQVDYLSEPKLDGLSIEIIYENGSYSRGATRGDGVNGEDVSQNVKTIKTVPLKLRDKNNDLPDMIAVRGEVIMHIDDFEQFNKELVERGEEPLANPRNAAAGSLRRLDSNETAKRPLDIFFYDLMDYEGGDLNLETQEEILKKLKEWGFKVNPHSQHYDNIEEAIKYHDEMENKREKLGYEIDGVVIKVNRKEWQEKLGVKTRSPRWAVAFKFPPRKKETKIMDIVVQVGRRGTLTPVSLLKPVDVEGVTVSRATLHNEDYIKEKDIKKGDWVKIARAGDVIPEVIDVNKKKRNGSEKEFIMPKKCPVCNSKVVKEGAYYRCTGGLSCEAQLKRAIEHFASKRAMDIEGLGGKTVDMLVDKNIVTKISDIYRIKKEDLTKQERWGDKSTGNILKAIEKSKEKPLSNFIYALGIPEVGRHVAKLLADKFGSIDQLMIVEKDKLLEIDEIGPEIAKNVVDFFEEKQNRQEIEDLKKLGVKMEPEEKTGELKGQRFVFTGALDSFTRSEAKEEIEKLGATATSNVSEKVDYVVVGENPGSKLGQAREADVKIIDEEEFKKLINKK